MAYDQGNVNGLWRLKPTGGDHMAIGKETPGPEAAHGAAPCVYGANGESERPKTTNAGNPFEGKPLS